MKKTPIEFSSAKANPGHDDVKDIDAEELKGLLDKVHLIDVRRPDEFTGELGHIKGARLIVLDTLPQHIDKLPKDEPIVFICRSGARSCNATAHALGDNFKHVFNLKGGMLRWNELGYPIEK
jgi:hydroxyacylglutathione hydrolase